MDDLKQLKLVKNIYIVMSLLFCVLGIFLMAKPKSSVKMLCVLMGIMLILYGAIKISGYFTRDAFCLAFQFDLAFGILLMAVGVILIARKNFAVDLIFSVFGILILADALFKIQMSVDAKRFGLALWWQILLIALVTGVIGVLVFIRPCEDGVGGIFHFTGRDPQSMGRDPDDQDHQESALNINIKITNHFR